MSSSAAPGRGRDPKADAPPEKRRRTDPMVPAMGSDVALMAPRNAVSYATAGSATSLPVLLRPLPGTEAGESPTSGRKRVPTPSPTPGDIPHGASQQVVTPHPPGEAQPLSPSPDPPGTVTQADVPRDIHSLNGLKKQFDELQGTLLEALQDAIKQQARMEKLIEAHVTEQEQLAAEFAVKYERLVNENNALAAANREHEAYRESLEDDNNMLESEEGALLAAKLLIVDSNKQILEANMTLEADYRKLEIEDERKSRAIVELEIERARLLKKIDSLVDGRESLEKANAELHQRIFTLESKRFGTRDVSRSDIGRDSREKTAISVLAEVAQLRKERDSLVQEKQAADEQVAFLKQQLALEQDAMIFASRQNEVNPGCSKSSPTSAAKDISLRESHWWEQPDEDISRSEYEALDALFRQFVRNRLVQELLCRPFAQRQPQLVKLYSKLFKHPMEFTSIQESLKSRTCQSVCSVHQQVKQMFDQNLQILCHEQVSDGHEEASKLRHLQQFFESLWDEYMLPAVSSSPSCQIFARRDHNRQRQLENSGHRQLTQKMAEALSVQLNECIESHGGLIGLDINNMFQWGGADELKSNLRELALQLVREGRNWTLESFQQRLLKCTPSKASIVRHDLLDRTKTQALNKHAITRHLLSFFWRFGTLFNEVCTRGVQPSSVWANAAKLVYVQEKKSKPYWSGLLLGDLCHSGVPEPWQAALLARNESRLPEYLAERLLELKSNCLKAKTKNYVLVEFLGCHEFAWIQAQNMKDFDPDADPNSGLALSKTLVERLEKAKGQAKDVNAEWEEALDSLIEDMGR